MLGLGFSATQASAQESPISIWYRSSEGCPDGSSFLSQLRELGQTARLAEVGDRIDFVVTLGSNESKSSGRVERQTQRGTIALRSVEDSSCEAVARALALTIELALDPDAPKQEEQRHMLPEGSGLAETERAAESEPRADRQLAAPASVPPKMTAPPEHGASTGFSRRGKSFAFGAQGFLATGLAPDPLPGAALFAEASTSAPLSASARVSFLAAYRTSSPRESEVSFSLWGGRLEGCPLSFGSKLTIAPCIGAELGALRAVGLDQLGRADAGFWAALVGHARAAYALSEFWWLDAQIGGLLPLVRYEVGPEHDDSVWFRTHAAGVLAAVGLKFSPL